MANDLASLAVLDELFLSIETILNVPQGERLTVFAEAIKATYDQSPAEGDALANVLNGATRSERRNATLVVYGLLDTLADQCAVNAAPLADQSLSAWRALKLACRMRRILHFGFWPDNSPTPSAQNAADALAVVAEMRTVCLPRIAGVRDALEASVAIEKCRRPEPDTATNEQGETDAIAGQDMTVGQRIFAQIRSDHEKINWSAEKWAKTLGCSKSAVAESEAWKEIIQRRQIKALSDAINKRQV